MSISQANIVEQALITYKDVVNEVAQASIELYVAEGVYEANIDNDNEDVIEGALQGLISARIQDINLHFELVKASKDLEIAVELAKIEGMSRIGRG